MILQIYETHAALLYMGISLKCGKSLVYFKYLKNPDLHKNSYILHCGIYKKIIVLIGSSLSPSRLKTCEETMNVLCNATIAYCPPLRLHLCVPD
jgi:hypothetical protein